MVEKLQNRAARVWTYSEASNYDIDVGHLFKLQGGKTSSFPAANSKSYDDGLQVSAGVGPKLS